MTTPIPRGWVFARIRSCAMATALATALLRATSVAQAPASRPLTLRDVTDSVRASFPALDAAESRVRAAAGARITAGLPANPVLSYQVDQTPFPGQSSLPPTVSREAMATATLPLEFLYQRGPKVARANADLRAAQADVQIARQQAALDAAHAFYQAAVAQTRVDVTGQLAAWLDTLVIYNQSRVAEGAAAEADLIRAQVERDRIRAALAMQQADLARARATLSTFTSSRATIAQPIAFATAAVSIPASRQITQVGDARAGVRADVRAAQERVAATTAAASIERRMRIPELGATVGTMQTMGTTSMIAGLSAPLPLFGGNRGEIRRASAERDAAQFELARVERSARADLDGALEAERLLADRVRELSSPDSSGMLARADESLRIALGAYREGAVPLFQVIDAARAWADARGAYYDILFAQHESVLMLLVANGVDLLTTIPTMPAFGELAR